MAQQQGLILLQPYLTLEAQHCQRIPQVGTGIAECYEFTIPANGQSQFPAVPDGSVDLVFGMSKQDVRLFIGGTVLQMKQWCLTRGERILVYGFSREKAYCQKICVYKMWSMRIWNCSPLFMERDLQRKSQRQTVCKLVRSCFYRPICSNFRNRLIPGTTWNAMFGGGFMKQRERLEFRIWQKKRAILHVICGEFLSRFTEFPRSCLNGLSGFRICYI